MSELALNDIGPDRDLLCSVRTPGRLRRTPYPALVLYA